LNNLGFSIAQSVRTGREGESMHITLNGETANIAEGSTVAGLLEHLQLPRERVAVEVNLDIVSKATYDSHGLSEGDRIEIVHFVGGG
jgi:sulfur carrier protein